MVVPEQLATEPLIRVKSGSKVPVVDNYEVEDVEVVSEWVEAGGNAGISLADSSYVVVDADTPEVVLAVSNLLPETFTVDTGGGGLGVHYYFDCPEWGRNTTLSDGDSSVRSGGWMAVVPPSVTAEEYTVAYDLPVARVQPEQLAELVDSLGNGGGVGSHPNSARRTTGGDLGELDELITHDGYRAEVRGVLEDRDAPHDSRVWLVGFLSDAVGLSTGEVVRLVDRHNRWSDYDRAITRRQVVSVVESGGSR